ncbi:hypothetical protein B5S28_g2662 [[Candida] boidinii]|nr:hypothetical protein B5S28_g2662 [[Candida] boidinii]OWB60280.1 hypothetical protein B5S29_g1151 [[Candida] boidinii]OWB71235.1 hypothetical protein B5S31_g920 [[Candida] boidinii]
MKSNNLLTVSLALLFCSLGNASDIKADNRFEGLQDLIKRRFEAREATPRYEETNFENLFKDSDRYGIKKRDGYVELKGFKSLKRKTDNKKRDNEDADEAAGLIFDGYTFNIPIEVGSEEDKMSVAITLNSGDLWVNSENWDPDCSNDDNDDCSQYGYFEFSKSATFKSLDQKFSVSMEDLSEVSEIMQDIQYITANGSYATDTLQLNDDIILKNFQFAVVSDSAFTSSGTLGIGPKALEYSSLTDNEEYDNFIYALQKQNFIKAPVLSILGGGNLNGDASLLLGAIDKSKISGDLYKIPFITMENIFGDETVTPNTTVINLNGISMGGYDISESDNKESKFWKSYIQSIECAATFELDEAQVSVPYSIAKTIASTFGFEERELLEFSIDCDKIKFHDFVSFNFQGIEIDIPLYELVQQYTGTNTCFFLGTGNDQAVLGDPFFRAAYVAIDYASNEVALANTNLEANYIPDEDSIELVTGAIDASTNSLYSSSYTGYQIEDYLGLNYNFTTTQVSNPTGLPAYYSVTELDRYFSTASSNSLFLQYPLYESGQQSATDLASQTSQTNESVREASKTITPSSMSLSSSSSSISKRSESSTTTSTDTSRSSASKKSNGNEGYQQLTSKLTIFGSILGLAIALL